jgi:hypothetical protein
MNRAAAFFLVCLLSLLATTVQAVPLSFRFSSVIENAAIGAEGVPPPFDDFTKVLGASITGSFTIESDVESFPAEFFENGQLVPLGLSYWNPVLRYDLTVAGQAFSFVSKRPTLEDGIQESSFTAIDRPTPSPNPFTNYDLYQLDTDFGVGQFDSPFAGLSVFATLLRQEHDLTLIQSTDMVTGLTTPAQWRIFFSIIDPETFNTYQLHGAVMDLQQVSDTPEPGVAGLLVIGAGMLGLAMRRRRQLPAASFITR